MLVIHFLDYTSLVVNLKEMQCHSPQKQMGHTLANREYPVHQGAGGVTEGVELIGARTGRGDTQKGAVRLDDAFSVTRSRELEHEYQPPFIETEFATSRCGYLAAEDDTKRRA